MSTSNRVGSVGATTFDRVLASGGESGALIRSLAWSTHPLGPIEGWPQSLKTALSICLSSRTPILVWWGRELHEFYNDAYRPVLGASKHPRAMGERGAVIWPEIWHIMLPIFEGVLSAGGAVGHEDMFMLLDRNGFPEETYFNHAHCPIFGDDGEIAGIFTTVTETTGKVIGERRLRTLKALAEAATRIETPPDACRSSLAVVAADAEDVPFAALYLVKGDEAELAASFGLAGDWFVPERITISADERPWPLAAAATQGEATVVDDVVLSPEDHAVTEGRSPPVRALVLPLGWDRVENTASLVLVAGLSPHLELDARYRDFLELVARHLATNVASARARDEQARRLRALEELDRAKTTFFDNVSHEFRTPLTLMLGPIEDALASDGRTLGGEALEAVHRNTHRLLRLVNRLLDLSRIEAGRLVPSREPTDLSIYTADLASAFRAAFEQAGLFLVVDCPPLPRLVSLDRDLWEKIVLNLLSNALKFTLEGGVTVTLRGDTDTATLIVSDTGIGIPEDELPRIFERFHRVPHARGRSQEGAGIGLSLSRDLVALHGGTLTASSIAGLGSAFVVKLPLGPVGSRSATPPARETRGTVAFADEAMRWQAPLASTTEEPSTATKQDVASKSRIVVVEDNADMRDYVERILSNDYALTLVADGREALLAVRRSPPDLVLSDVMMPELDGFALLAAIRADPRLAQIPVILLSARAGEESRLDGLKAGADDYLTKPFSARELTLRVATHLALGRARKDATAARDILRNVLLQAPVAVSLVTGADFVYELANQTYEQMVGKKGLVGRKFRDVFPELVDDAPVLSMLRAVRESGEPFNATEYKVPLVRGPSGELEDVYFLFTCQPVIVPFGESDSILTVAVDVTEQVALRRNLELVSAEREHLLAQERAARNDAESSSRAKDQFLAMLGHELRNPLAPITTALHLMRLGPEQAYERERAVIERQVDHLMRLVDNLLDVSRITRGTIELRKVRIELAEVIAKAVEVTSPLLEARRHHLEILVNSRGRAVFANPARMTQVVSNLLSNAAKYTDEGGHITIESRLEGEELALSVRDDGIGIDPAMLPFVFDTFVQETQSIERSHGGLGLGLAIVKNIVAMHGGRATVKSDGKGKGSIFTIHLPAIEQLDRLSPEPELPALPVAAADPSYGRVLVVDDNADAAELLAELLRVVGAEVRIAHDGLSALEIAELFTPSIGLIDIGLPLIDGYEVARRLRQTVKEPLFLVAITGYGQDQDRARSSAAGFDAHFVKPVDFSALDALLRSRRSAEVPLESAG